MLTVLLRSQSDVRARLFELVDSSPRPVLVAQERDLSEGGPFERRMPYRHLLEHGVKISMIVVADDGNEGLWRDPVGELAAREFSSKDDIAGATSGLLLYREGLEPTYLRRDLWDPLNDLRALAARLRLDIPIPEKPKAAPERPRFRKAPVVDDDEPTAADVPPDRDAEPTNPDGLRPEEPDPFAVLGVTNTVSEDELKKAFRALIVQYHPDKVAHLAPEFQKLAEEKTRELTAAYEAAQRLLRGEPSSLG